MEAPRFPHFAHATEVAVESPVAFASKEDVVAGRQYSGDNAAL